MHRARAPGSVAFSRCLSRLAAMSTQPPGSAGPASASVSRPTTPPALEHDWTGPVTDRIESVVGTVRDKTTIPVTKVARAVVFGLLAAVAALIALVLVIDAVARIIDVYLPFDPYGRRVWVGDAALGAIFLVAGAFCWSKRTRKPQETRQ
jgi:hypothetical protein